MGNAPDFLKEKADYVTDSIDHDGVVTALEHFGLSSQAPTALAAAWTNRLQPPRSTP